MQKRFRVVAVDRAGKDIQELGRAWTHKGASKIRAQYPSPEPVRGAGPMYYLRVEKAA